MKFGPRKQRGVLVLGGWVAVVVAGGVLVDADVVVLLVACLTGVVAAAVAQTWVDVRRQGRQTRAPLRQSAELDDRMEQLVAGSRLGDHLQSLRTDVEWLEDVLQGLTENVSDLRETQEAERGDVRDALEEQSRALLALASTARTPRSPEAALRTLAPSPVDAVGTDTSRRLNTLGEALPRPRRYLEIGLSRGLTFEAVGMEKRLGVDPQPGFDVSILPRGASVVVDTSDHFFDLVAPSLTFDLVFIDGLHTFQQAYTDLMNALAHASKECLVLIDDVVPVDEPSAIPNLSRSVAERRRRGLGGMPWHGDVFRLMPVLRDHHPQLQFRTIVGSGNEQSLLWWPDRGDGLLRLPPAELAPYADVRYGDVFGDGVPDYFFPCAEDEAIASALRSL